MAISKIVYKSSPSATPVTWMDATTATAAAADITAPKTAMLADGVVTTGTGTGGGGVSITVEQLPGGGEHYIISGTQSTGGVEYGTFTVTSDIGLADAGTTVNIGFSGQPDLLYVWMDRASFEALGTWANNTHYKFMLIKNDQTLMATSPYLRYSASEDWQTTLADASYIRYTAPNVTTTTDSNNPVGYTISGTMGMYNRNLTVNAINSDGTITFAKHSTAGSYIKAGTYHYYAVTGMAGILL